MPLNRRCQSTLDGARRSSSSAAASGLPDDVVVFRVPKEPCAEWLRSVVRQATWQGFLRLDEDRETRCYSAYWDLHIAVDGARQASFGIGETSGDAKEEEEGEVRRGVMERIAKYARQSRVCYLPIFDEALRELGTTGAAVLEFPPPPTDGKGRLLLHVFPFHRIEASAWTAICDAVFMLVLQHFQIDESRYSVSDVHMSRADGEMAGRLFANVEYVRICDKSYDVGTDESLEHDAELYWSVWRILHLFAKTGDDPAVTGALRFSSLTRGVVAARPLASAFKPQSGRQGDDARYAALVVARAIAASLKCLLQSSKDEDDACDVERVDVQVDVQPPSDDPAQIEEEDAGRTADKMTTFASFLADLDGWEVVDGWSIATSTPTAASRDFVDAYVVFEGEWTSADLRQRAMMAARPAPGSVLHTFKATADGALRDRDRNPKDYELGRRWLQVPIRGDGQKRLELDWRQNKALRDGIVEASTDRLRPPPDRVVLRPESHAAVVDLMPRLRWSDQAIVATTPKTMWTPLSVWLVHVQVDRPQAEVVPSVSATVVSAAAVRPLHVYRMQPKPTALAGRDVPF